MRAVNSCSQLASSWPSGSRRQVGPQRRLLPPTHAAPDVLPAARALEQLGSSPRAQPETPMVPPDPATSNSLLQSSDALSAALESSSNSDDGQFPTGKDSPTFMESLRINTRIIQATTLPELEEILYEELPAIEACDLGCVNLSSSFYHATRLWGDAERLLRDSAREDGNSDARAEIRKARAKQLDPVLVLLRPHLVSMPDRTIVQPYDLAISLWCMATLQLQDEDLFQALTDRTRAMVKRLKATDMAMAMWACGRMRCGSTMLCSQLTVAAIGRVGEFKTCELSTFIWGMCHTGQQSPEILRAAAQRMVEHPGDFASEELVRLLWSFTRMRWREARLIDVHARTVAELARPERAAKLLPQDFSNALWSLAQMQVFAEAGDLDVLADVAAGQLHRFKEQELANLVYGYGSQRHWHEGLMTAAATEVLLRKERFQDKELCMFLWAVGILGVAPGGELFLTAVANELHARVSTLKPLSISNAMKAFAKLRYLPQAEIMDSMSEAAVASLDEFNMSELSNLLWAYAQLGWTDEELFESAEEFTMDSIHLCTKHHVSSIANSFKASGYLCERLVTVARHHGFHV